MYFVYPHFLWAALLIAIPIAVHLFHFRRYSTVYFSRVDLLKEVVEERHAMRRIKHLLVLLSRILALLCLVAAFAQPFVPYGDAKNRTNITSVYIDNSYSMQAEGKNGNLLNEAKNKAIALVQSIDPDEKVHIITTDLEAKHQQFYPPSEAVEQIKSIDFSSLSTSLSTILNLQSDLLHQSGEEANRRLFLFSDFQATTHRISAQLHPEVRAFYQPLVPQQEGNISIDSVWFETPVHKVNTPTAIHFRAVNRSEKEVTSVAVTLTINGNFTGLKSIDIPPLSFVDASIAFADDTAGLKSGELALTAEQLPFDDTFYFTYTIKEAVPILIVKGKDDPSVNAEQLYGLNPYYRATVTTIDAVNQDDFVGKELVILQHVNAVPSGILDVLDRGIERGVTVVLIPGRQLEPTSWNGFMRRRQLPLFGEMDTVNRAIRYFNHEDPLYAGVFEKKPESYRYPIATASYRLIRTGQENYLPLFETEEGPFLYYSNQKNGRIVAMSTPLDMAYSNFQHHALFAATFLRIAETAALSKPLYLSMGQLRDVPLYTVLDEGNPIHLVNTALGVDVLPPVVRHQTGLAISFRQIEDLLRQSGVYTLTNYEQFHEQLALNYSRKESDIARLSTAEIQSQFEKAGWEKAAPLATSEGSTIEASAYAADEYWRILLILALVFIAAEVLLLRLWRP